ncbi:STAS/SEC14 domain-containing protein [Hymenobacter volaticus]|uniref:STAS/SEC14 domain-containing protein n=1 Tax=Hymenobacter volaticus TaxID=2932254 RepID=A0ABY4G0B5_9BACT|nr:STAS/SEC14 domain-containing protein [Hymenobacter volaticus]UOQ64248.1 STAS/SEC14 domain-containing protein [Hymenobacter volaticus]
MSISLLNGFGKVYLTIEYDAINHWVHNQWIGSQTYVGIIAGADACLHPLSENACSYLLNDNRQVIGGWNHAVEWIASDWAPRAAAQGLTHFAQVVSPESLAALSAEAMHTNIGDRLQIRMFSNIDAAQAWLRDVQRKAANSLA